MNEATRKKNLVADVIAIGGKARRYEDRFAVGLLDLGIKLPDVPFFWAEGKLIRGQAFGPTPSQFQEGQEWEAAGVRVFLIGWKGNVMAVSPWVERADMRSCFVGFAHAGTLQDYFGTMQIAERFKPR